MTPTEYAIALKELKENPLEALKASHKRFEATHDLALAESDTKPSCGSGCSYCCSMRVMVKPLELLYIKSYMSRNFSVSERGAVLKKAKTNHKVIKKMTPVEHSLTNIPCAFLKDNKCSIYKARPFACRGFHSTSLDNCVTVYHEPKALILTSMIPSVANKTRQHIHQFESAAHKLGYDLTSSEMNTGLVKVLTDPRAYKRYIKTVCPSHTRNYAQQRGLT